ncbi:hypothetical protein CJP74_02145 [Psittacicella melopsittaci]|uniref:Uncharacterized protein n=1 Tax=Psittacicella melopsittaci TaxID=2028576 RepID=A0A3A1Y7Q4_9GAMM|nr:hypothetical protein [Psittacicella melopsittaci]RIY33248.1 hypothetical protein CJP74_02145 [Psittacicella melopsittaci]
MSEKENYTKHGENVTLHEENINVSGTADVTAQQTAKINKSNIQAGKGVNIKGGSVNIQGSSIISGGNVVISGQNVVLNGATITSDNNLEINSQTTEVSNEVSLTAAKAKLKGENLNITDNSSLNIKAKEYQEEVENKNLGKNSEFKVDKD